jgi:hypothetical protein
MSDLPNTSILAPSILKVLLSGESKRYKEIDDEVAVLLSIREETLKIMRSGGRSEYAYRMSWARQKLKESGDLENLGKGIWKRIS